MKEWQCTKEELMAFKESSKMCFTDSSVALASERKRVPLFTIDRRFVGWCRSRGIEAKDVYGELYFSNLGAR
jgi:hypothetical protein